MKKASVLLVAIALALFGLAACGDDDDDEDTTAAETTTTDTAGGGAAGGAGGTVDLSAPASGDFAYDQASASTTAGSVTINFDNPASLSHDVVIEDESGAELGKTDLVSQGNTSVTVDLGPGTYTYYCDVAGHREGGMEGTLTVK
jgi:plastocyanin